MRDQAIYVAHDRDQLCRAAAQRIVDLARSAIEDHGAFYVALSGGSTPVHLHRILASPIYRDNIAWDRVHIYFGDERNVSPDHPDSNYRMAHETLLTEVPIPASQIHPVPTCCENMPDCARQYAQTLGGLPQSAGMPVFDLILLGMGEDGHTASLFPQTSILDVRSEPVAAVFVDKLDTWRISLTYPVLDQARNILVLVSGEGKAEILNEVLNQPDRHYPVQRVRNTHLQWYVDKAAAARLMESDVGISG